MLAIILATKLYALFTEGYGGYDLTLGWAIIAALFIFGLLINAAKPQGGSKMTVSAIIMASLGAVQLSASNVR